MAKQLVTDSGILKRPGAYGKYTVQSAPAGLATTGVLMLVGEAEGGQHWSAESDLETNAFGPDSLAEVAAKYGSGPLVDAFRGAISASADPDIVGSFNRAILVKTNSGTKSSAALTRLVGSGTWATMYDKSFGLKGNKIQMSVTSAQAEVVPTTGSFTYIPVVGTAGINCNLALRVNGGAAQALVVPQNQTPTAFVSAINGLTGVLAAGGVSRSVITAPTTITVVNTGGNTATFSASSWANTPVAGDTLVVGASAAIAGTGTANVGAYVVVSASATVITATKLSDAGRAASTPVTTPITAPVGASGSTAAADFLAYSPVTVSTSGAAVLTGAGKSLAIANTDSAATSSVQLASAMLFGLGTTVAAPWISTAVSPQLLTSATESKVTLSAARTDDSITESFTVGGEVVLKVGYSGGAATLTITSTTLTTSTGLSLPLADFATVKAISDFLNAQSGYTASVGTAAMGLLPASALDRVSAIGISNQFGTVQPGRIKVDAYRLYNAVTDGSRLLQVGNPSARPDAGLPAVTPTVYLAGGLKGATTSAEVSAALAGLENVEGNFLVTLFSRDATSDVTDGITDSGSTYTIAEINAAAKSHVLAMSQFKRRRNRQAISSIQGSFQSQQDAAANTATFRVNMTFQNIKALDSQGDLQTFQPWMGAVKAASMQSAGFYRAITNKLIDINGITHAVGDFNPKSDSNMEDALTAGLMPIKPSRIGGGWSWESDQTTYGQDDNFVFNSLQAVYAADTIALTTGQRMEQAFVGKSTADISAQVALTYLDQIMGDFLRLKLIAPSDDAKRGYKNASIRISGNAMLVSVEIKLATGIDFVVIDFLVSPVQQTA